LTILLAFLYINVVRYLEFFYKGYHSFRGFIMNVGNECLSIKKKMICIGRNV
jgi:hypothetical protein